MEDSGRNQYIPDAYFCLHLSSEMYVGTSSGKKNGITALSYSGFNWRKKTHTFECVYT